MLSDSFEDEISNGLKKISHKLTSEEVQNIEKMIEIDREKKELKSLEDKKRVLKKLLSPKTLFVNFWLRFNLFKNSPFVIQYKLIMDLYERYSVFPVIIYIK